MQTTPEIQFQISLLNLTTFGEAARQTEELERLLEEQVPVEKR
jgi:hypothetical protein